MFETYEEAKFRTFVWTLLLAVLYGSGAWLVWGAEAYDIAAIVLGHGILLSIFYPLVIARWIKARKNRWLL